MSLAGVPKTEEHKRKISEALRGHRLSEETRRKIAETLRGRPLSAETKAKLSLYHTANPVRFWLGKQRPEISLETRKRLGEAHRGEKCNFWKGGKRKESRVIRDSLEYREWRRQVFARDAFTCVRCGVRGGHLHAHHKKPFATHPELRFDVNNGETLCLTCHRAEHKGQPLRARKRK